MPYVIDPAITYRANSFTGDSGTSIVLNTPAGTRVGDVLVAQVAVRSSDRDDHQAGERVDAGRARPRRTARWRSALFYHQYVSGDGASFTFTLQRVRASGPPA